MAGQVGVRATVSCDESESDCLGRLTARSGQILQSKGLSSDGSEQPRAGSRNGQRVSSFGSLVLYWSEMSKV